MIITIAIIASVAAFVGGTIALKMKDKLHLVLGFSAGAVIGAALFDLIPEAIEIGSNTFHIGDITALTAAGFIVYLILDRIFSFHGHAGLEHEQDHSTNELNRGVIGAISFSLHSLIDGLAIGFAFQAGGEIGTIVAIAVIAHRFSDGINTVGVILKHQGERHHAKIWLVIVGLAPIVGAALTFLIKVHENVLSVLLAVFAGFFLYIGASDLIPEGHHSHSKIMTTLMTVLGALVLYTIVQFVK